MEDELLAFPPENTEVSPLTESEIITVRKMIAEYNLKNSQSKFSEKNEIKPNSNASNLFQPEESLSVKPAVTNLFNDEPIMPSNTSDLFFTDDNSSNNTAQSFIGLLDYCNTSDYVETEVLTELKNIISKTEGNVEKTLITAILGLFPCKRYIRHGTHEQKLFVLKTLSDRFLEKIAGLKFQERKRLLKVIAKYLTDISDNYTFIPMEGEPFKPTLHERVTGSSSNGMIVKEMRGFLVVDSMSNKVIYTGLVLS